MTLRNPSAPCLSQHRLLSAWPTLNRVSLRLAMVSSWDYYYQPPVTKSGLYLEKVASRGQAGQEEESEEEESGWLELFHCQFTLVICHDYIINSPDIAINKQ